MLFRQPILLRPRLTLRFARRVLADAPHAALAVVRLRGPFGFLVPLAFLVVGGAAYGAAMGAWRDPRLALFVAVKLPILLTATALVDALANGLWARRLGLAISLAESLRAVLLAFALAAVVLGSFAPVLWFFARTMPGPDSAEARTAHDLLGLAHVAVIALAGSLAVSQQGRWIAALDRRAGRAGVVVALWLALNLVVGAQLSWNLRPWFGSPGMPVSFLRDHPFDGTFYESVVHMLLHP